MRLAGVGVAETHLARRIGNGSVEPYLRNNHVDFGGEEGIRTLDTALDRITV